MCAGGSDRELVGELGKNSKNLFFIQLLNLYLYSTLHLHYSMRDTKM